MSDKIGDGANIFKKQKIPKSSINIDSWYDPIIRADYLLKTLLKELD